MQRSPVRLHVCTLNGCDQPETEAPWLATVSSTGLVRKVRGGGSS